MCVWQPDTWGEYVYDTAWMFAHAIADLRQRGVSPRDGRALRAALLNTSFGGVTGHITMGPDQDRAMASESASMHMAGSALADAFSHDRLLASPRLAPRLTVRLRRLTRARTRCCAVFMLRNLTGVSPNAGNPGAGGDDAGLLLTQELVTPPYAHSLRWPGGFQPDDGSAADVSTSYCKWTTDEIDISNQVPVGSDMSLRRYFA